MCPSPDDDLSEMVKRRASIYNMIRQRMTLEWGLIICKANDHLPRFMTRWGSDGSVRCINVNDNAMDIWSQIK